MSKQVTLLKDLKGSSKNAMIKVKIVSLWRKKMNGSDTETYRIDMILMDEMGMFIVATCYHKLFYKFEKMLNLDEYLFISTPSVAGTTYQKYVDNDKKLSLFYKTTITKCTTWEGPKYCFNFANFKSILQKKIPENKTIDFIGYVVVCYNLEDVEKKDGTTVPRINFKLQDIEGQKIDATLWEEHAIRMSAYMLNKERDLDVIVLVHFGAVNNYKGKLGVTNSYEAARVFINTDIEEINSFKKRYLEKYSDNESSGSSTNKVGSYMISSSEDEFLNNTGFILIDYLCSIKIEKKVVIMAKIIEISTEHQWYYKGCNYCKSKVEQKFVSYEKDDGSCDIAMKQEWECSNENCVGQNVFEVIRYKIPLKVQDCSGTTSLTLFDYEASKLLGKPAKAFVEEQDEMLNNGQFPPAYPDEFQQLIGKKFAFQIKVARYNIEHQRENYGIMMITKDDDIISRLYKKWEIARHEKNYSIGVASVSDIQSTTPEDNVSFSDENGTPVSTATKVVDKGKGVDLKRNVEDVIDVDDSEASSTNKRRNLEKVDGDNSNESFKLLTPKLEK